MFAIAVIEIARRINRLHFTITCILSLVLNSIDVSAKDLFRGNKIEKNREFRRGILLGKCNTGKTWEINSLAKRVLVPKKFIAFTSVLLSRTYHGQELYFLLFFRNIKILFSVKIGSIFLLRDSIQICGCTAPVSTRIAFNGMHLRNVRMHT